MAHLCEMNQIGHVASVKTVGKNLIVRIASNANYKNGDGARVERTHWNDHTIFERQGGLLKWASESLKPGDLVLIRSTPFQTEWKRDPLRSDFRGERALAADRQVGQKGEAGRRSEIPQPAEPLTLAGEGAFQPPRR